jgi:hypothetical protein
MTKTWKALRPPKTMSESMEYQATREFRVSVSRSLGVRIGRECEAKIDQKF